VSAVPTTVEAVAATVQPGVGAITAMVQARFDAIALAVESIRPTVMAMCGGVHGTTIQALVDAITAKVEAMVDAVALAVEAMIHAIAEVAGARGRTRGQQSQAQAQGHSQPCLRVTCLHGCPPAGGARDAPAVTACMRENV
jgi:hypothetical protein